MVQPLYARGRHHCGQLLPAGSRALCSCHVMFSALCSTHGFYYPLLCHCVGSAQAGSALIFAFIFCCVSPVPSLLTASSPAVVSPVAALPLAPLPSLLPLWLVQPTPSNSPAAVTATVLTSAPGATVVVRVVLSVVSSGSRHAHFAKLNAEKAKDKELPWIHVSCSIQLEVLCC
jgi:hypothetical protein